MTTGGAGAVREGGGGEQEDAGGRTGQTRIQ
jgi:hypothetical protein